MTTSTGADLARTALRAARQVARTSGNASTQRTTRQATVVRRGLRKPEPIADVFLALVAAHGWTLGTAGGSLRDRWPAIVGPEAAAHWHLAGYDPTTRRLRVVADSPAWAAQLRYQTRRILTDLEQLRPGTVRAIDVRVGHAPMAQYDQGLDDRPARQAALDEAAAEREAILHRHYNRLREPENAHRPAIEDSPTPDVDEHTLQQRERHHAALAVARATRAGAIPLRTTRLAPLQTGAA
ncbi:DciA family protein (plasmid) [Kitasatospora griseola]|uniref:DciA family protein n=1 Tax=Kitasatospora griseola TaxID=2064 RepID=UPI003855D179